MPLNTQILRDGKPLDVTWDYKTLSLMYTVAFKEGDPNYEYQDGKKFADLPDGAWIDFSWAPIYYLKSKCGLVKKGRQVLKNRHEFDTVTFEPGDVLTAYRSHS